MEQWNHGALRRSLCCQSGANGGRWRADHCGFLYNGVVGLLQVAVEDVTEHTGRVLVQIPSSLGHTVVFTPDGNVDALFLRKNNGNSSTIVEQICLGELGWSRALHGDLLTSRASVMMQPMTAQIRRVPSMSSLRREDLSWSMGTNQAPIAGVAVLSRFNCLERK